MPRRPHFYKALVFYDTDTKKAGQYFTTRLYQPASRFWEFQVLGFAVFAGLGVLLIAFAAWRMLRTD